MAHSFAFYSPFLHVSQKFYLSLFLLKIVGGLFVWSNACCCFGESGR